MADNDVLNDKLSATEEGAHQSKMADYVIIEDYVKKLLAIHSGSCEDHQDQKKVGSNDVLNGELPATEEGAHQSKMADYVIIEDYVKKLLAIHSGSCEDHQDQKKVGSNDVLNGELPATEEGAHQSKMADYVIIENYMDQLLAIGSGSCEDHQDQKKVGSNDVLNGELRATEEGAHQSKMADYVIIDNYMDQLLAIHSGSCENHQDQKKIGDHVVNDTYIDEILAEVEDQENPEKMNVEGDAREKSGDEFCWEMVESVGNSIPGQSDSKESITAQKVKADEGEGSARS
nr:hypothetical protein Iba_chr06dCG10470 [Ipomoea batatas]